MATTNTKDKSQDARRKPRLSLYDWMTPPPKYRANPFSSPEAVRQSFGLPVSLGLSSEQRYAMDSAFGGYDTIYESLIQHSALLGQYPLTTFLGYGVLQQIAQNGMIRACIQTTADDMTREWIEITGGDESNPDTIVNLQDYQENKYRLRSLFNRAFATVGYMGGAFIYIDTGAQDDDLMIPLEYSERSAELVQGTNLNFVLVDPINVSPGDYNCTNALREDYMKPRYWNVLGKRVHTSRLIALVDNPPPQMLLPAYNFLGIPQAQILWDYVMHWNKARETGVNLLEKLNLLVFQTSMDELMEGGGIENLDAKMMQLTRYRDNSSVFVCDKDDEDVKNVTLTISGAVDIIRQALENVASINRTPAVKLLGISPSGFNATGESDIRNYYDHIRSKQGIYKSAIQTILDCIQLVEFGVIDTSINFKFNELGAEDEASTVATAKTKADTLCELLDRNVLNADEVREAVRRDENFELDNLTDGEIGEVAGNLMTDLVSPEGKELIEQYKAKKEHSAQEALQVLNALNPNVQAPQVQAQTAPAQPTGNEANLVATNNISEA